MGEDVLLKAIAGRLGEHDEELNMVVPATAAPFIHWLHENTSVLGQDAQDDGGVIMRVRVGKERRGRLAAQLDKCGARILWSSAN
jgi:50S ribosomal subunit-associated GTPase HflX